MQMLLSVICILSDCTTVHPDHLKEHVNTFQSMRNPLKKLRLTTECFIISLELNRHCHWDASCLRHLCVP